MASLTACDQFLPEPLAYTRVDGVPIVRVCLPLAITSIEVSREEVVPASNGASRTSFRIVWAAVGEAKVEAGTELEVGATLEGLEVVHDDEVEWRDGVFTVAMSVSHDVGGSWQTFSYIDGRDLSEGEWLNSYGESEATPCTHGDCNPVAACHNNWPEPTGYPTQPQPTFSPVPTGNSEAE